MASLLKNHCSWKSYSFLWWPWIHNRTSVWHINWSLRLFEQQVNTSANMATIKNWSNCSKSSKLYFLEVTNLSVASEDSFIERRVVLWLLLTLVARTNYILFQEAIHVVWENYSLPAWLAEIRFHRVETINITTSPKWRDAILLEFQSIVHRTFHSVLWSGNRLLDISYELYVLTHTE